MGIHSKGRYSRKNPNAFRPSAEEQKRAEEKAAAARLAAQTAQGAPTTPSVPTQDPSIDTAGTAATRRALGGVGDGPSGGATAAGAKNALHGMGLFGRVKKTLTKGLLVAMTGLTLMGNLGPGATSTLSPAAGHAATSITALSDNHATAPRGHGQRALSDAQRVLDGFDASARADATFEVTSERAAALLVAGVLPATPPATQKLESFARDQLGNDTKQLIGALLDSGRLKVAPEARRTLEIAIGRVHAATSDGKLVILGDQTAAIIKVRGAPGASIEAINLSTIPTKRLHTDDTFVLGTVGADGSFAGKMEMQAGDLVRMRLKSADGSATEWVDFKATGMGADTRNAEVALFRIGLVDINDGRIAVNNINTSRPVSEPGAVMRLVNLRTQESTDITFDSKGTFPAGTTVPGKTGDQFSVRITDGTTDPRLETEVSKLSVREPGKPAVVEAFDLKDPTLHSDELDEAGKPKFSVERFRGPLFEDAAKFTDVTQGQIGDCYFPAAISAIAFHRPGTFEKIIQQKEELDTATGQTKVWYEVTFKKYDWNTRGYTDHIQRVDGDLYVRNYGGPLYGADDGQRTPEGMELWFAILEKAYADWKGESYEAIGNGGHIDQVFRDTLGVAASRTSVSDADEVWKVIRNAVDNKLPIGAGTHGDDQEARYANSGVYADHAYSILGAKEEDGVKYVQLRNPWGESEPFPGDGKNDGVFWLKLDTFMKLYQSIYSVTGDSP